MQTNPELGEETCRSLFGYLGKHPGPWWLSSLRLKEAADALRDNCWPRERQHHDVDAATADFRTGPVYMLLMGMAVEAALKTILVAEDPNLVGMEKISNTIGNHRLRKLWNLTGLGKVQSQQTDSLLDRLENCLVIFGRYPVSKKAGDMEKMLNSSFQGQLHFDQVAGLWTRLEKHVKGTIPELFDETTQAPCQPSAQMSGDSVPNRRSNQVACFRDSTCCRKAATNDKETKNE